MQSKRSLLIGSFDGLHLGHQFLIEEFKSESLNRSANPSVLTYQSHPLKVIKPNLLNYYIDSDEKRVARLSKEVSTIAANFEEFREMSASHFFEKLTSSYKDIKYIFMGHDSSFGCDKVSDVKTLNSLNLDLEFIPLPKYHQFDVSSTILREAIREGKLDKFYKLTRRDFSIESKVIPGKQLGRTIGYPTANLYVDPSRVRLPNGVYYGHVAIKKLVYKFVANIGLRPTVDDDEAISIEAHILDFDQDIYGKKISLRIDGKVRGIKKFNSKDDLMKQITKDVEFVRGIDV